MRPASATSLPSASVAEVDYPAAGVGAHTREVIAV